MKIHKEYIRLVYLVMLHVIVSQELWGQNEGLRWALILHQEGVQDRVALELPRYINKDFKTVKKLGQIRIDFSLQAKGTYTVFNVTASAKSPTAVYFSLRGFYEKGTPYNFNGEVKNSEIYRQSPHDLDAWIVKTIPEQAVPVVALRNEQGFAIALNGSPALYDNFTSQEFSSDRQYIALCSGDSGESPGMQPDTSKVLNLDYNAENGQKFTPGKVIRHFHQITLGKNHQFEGLIVQSKAQDFNALRKDINLYAATHFSGGKINNYFGALAFTTAYMNLRSNDSGKSKYWVVPSVEYANVQYGRDAFWIATMLPPQFDAECMKSELHTVNPFAEYPLFAIIWAYRAFKNKAEVPLSKVQAYVDEIERRAKNNCYYSYDPQAGRLDFQYWGDLMAFEKEDVISFNQGLFALALQAAQEMGLKISSNPEAAAEQYRRQFNQALGFVPISRLKNNVLGPDPLAPDLIAQIYFGKKLLPTEQVKSHFYHMYRHSRTPFGYKVIAAADGTFLPNAGYDVPGYKSQANREGVIDGQYFRGGSYFLYDNLFLLDAYLHGIPEAEGELMWRIGLDFKAGNTTYECLNTLNGEPWKPNMGWNVAIYAFWQHLVDQKLASTKLFEHIDKIAANAK